MSLFYTLVYMPTSVVIVEVAVGVWELEEELTWRECTEEKRERERQIDVVEFPGDPPFCFPSGNRNGRSGLWNAIMGPLHSLPRRPESHPNCHISAPNTFKYPHIVGSHIQLPICNFLTSFSLYLFLSLLHTGTHTGILIKDTVIFWCCDFWLDWFSYAIWLCRFAFYYDVGVIEFFVL